MAEVSATEKSPSPPFPPSLSPVAANEESDRKTEDEAIRVNSRTSVRSGSRSNNNTTETVEESNHYLSGRRLILVHTGILL